jgi:hypothetical protein
MKLSKPITIRINHVEDAVWMAMYYSHDQPMPKHNNAQAILNSPDGGEVASQLFPQIECNGINWRTWLPPQPFKIAGRECEFNADGAVKLSCGTVISSAEIEEFEKRREEAKKPKTMYWRANYSGNVYRAAAESEVGEFFKDGEWRGSYGRSMGDWASYKMCTPITRSEAAAIIGEENLNK